MAPSPIDPDGSQDGTRRSCPTQLQIPETKRLTKRKDYLTVSIDRSHLNLDLSPALSADEYTCRLSRNDFSTSPSSGSHMNSKMSDISPQVDGISSFLHQLEVEQESTNLTACERTRQLSGSSGSSVYSTQSVDEKPMEVRKSVSAPRWHKKIGTFFDKRKSMNAAAMPCEDDLELWDNGEIGQYAPAQISKERAKSGILPQQALSEGPNEIARLETVRSLDILDLSGDMNCYREQCERLCALTGVSTAAVIIVDKFVSRCVAVHSDGHLTVPTEQNRAKSLSSFVVLNGNKPFVVPTFGPNDQHWLFASTDSINDFQKPTNSLSFFLGYPIRIGDNVVGALALYDDMPRPDGFSGECTAQIERAATELAKKLLKDRDMARKISEITAKADKAAQALRRSIEGPRFPQNSGAQREALQKASSVIQAVLELDCACILRVSPSLSSITQVDTEIIASSGFIAPPRLTAPILLSALRSRSGLLYRNPDLSSMKGAFEGSLESFASGMVVPIAKFDIYDEKSDAMLVTAAFTKVVTRNVLEADIAALKPFEDTIRMLMSRKLRNEYGTPPPTPFSRPSPLATHTRSSSTTSSVSSLFHFSSAGSKASSNASSDEERSIKDMVLNGRAKTMSPVGKRASPLAYLRRSLGSSSVKEFAQPQSSIGLPYSFKSGDMADGPWIPHPALINARDLHRQSRNSTTDAEGAMAPSMTGIEHSDDSADSESIRSSFSTNITYDKIFDYYCEPNLLGKSMGANWKSEHVKALGSIAAEALDKIEEEGNDSTFEERSSGGASSTSSHASLPKTPDLSQEHFDHPLSYLSQQRRSSISKRKPTPKPIKKAETPHRPAPVVIYDYM